MSKKITTTGSQLSTLIILTATAILSLEIFMVFEGCPNMIPAASSKEER